MAKAKKKGGKEIDEATQLSEAEKKALEKLDHTSLLIEIQGNRKRIDDLSSEIYDLNQRIRIIQDENLAMTLKMEADINDRTDQIQQLQFELEQLKKTSEDRYNVMLEEKDKKIRFLGDQTTRDLKDKDKRIEELSNQLAKISHLEEREEEYQKKITELENRYKQQEYSHNDQMKKMEKNFFKQNQNLESVNKAKIDDIIRNADKIAEKKVKDSEDRIKKENIKLKQELEIHQKELEQLRKERVTMVEENNVLKKNISINQDGASEYQTLQHRQSSKIKKLKEKVQYLKNYIAEEVQRYTKEIELMKYQNQSKLQEYDYQCRNLREQLQLKNKELQKIRIISQMILDQRSDIEQFFLEALDQVRQEIKKKSLPEKKSKLPEISQKSLVSQQSVINEDQKSKSHDKVDISELDLEEKEKLLRILFSKMNQGLPPQNWKSQDRSQIDIGNSFRDNQPSQLIKSTTNHNEYD